MESKSAAESKATSLRSGSITETPPAVRNEETISITAVSRKRRWSILAVLILSYFIDVACSSAFFVFTGEIARDLGIVFEQQSWIVVCPLHPPRSDSSLQPQTAFSAPFAALLLFWGRVSDLYSARDVFIYGFLGFASISLILSFLTEQYSFLLLRAFAGVSGSALVPSAYRLIAYNFPEDERGRAYTLYGMTGSIANVMGVIIAGVIGAIEGTGQMRNWRWFFRIVAALSFPGTLLGFFLIPKEASRKEVGGEARWKRLDPIGTLLMLSSILLIIVGLTMGASYGWITASFLAPIIIGLLLFPTFFLWESRLPEDVALLPNSIWKIPNMITLIAFALVILGWWAVNFIPFIELLSHVHGDPIIIAAVRTLPEGVAAAAVSFVLLKWPHITAKPKWPIAISMVLAGVALVLWTQATSIIGVGYWQFVFPGMLIGSAGMQIVLLATMYVLPPIYGFRLTLSVAVMIAAPPERAGVVGATLQTSMHTSTVIALSIQAGLLTTQPGGLYNYANIRASWYFELGWVVVWLIGFLVFYRPARNPAQAGSVEAAV